MKSFAKYNYNNHVKDMDMACRTHGGEGIRTGLWRDSQKERDDQEDLDVGGRIISKPMLGNGEMDVEYTASLLAS
jgi:hypothetical protein